MEVSSLLDIILDSLIYYLSEDDVLRCSMVNRDWRELFNRNQYWRALCLRHHKESLFNFLKHQPCQVEPKFHVPLEENSPLQRPCEWKMNYMRAKHLKRNRDEGRYVVHEVMDRVNGCSGNNVVKGSNGKMVYVFVENNCLELRNITDTNSLQSKIQLPLKDSCAIPFTCSVTSSEQIIVITHVFIMQVFKLSGTKYILQDEVLIGQPDRGRCDVDMTSMVNCWETEDNYYCTGEVFGNLFVGVCSDYDSFEFTLLVWNLEHRRKDKSVKLGEIPQLFTHPSVKILRRLSDVNVVVRVDYTGDSFEPRSTIFKYNLVSGEQVCVQHISNMVYLINENLLARYEGQELQCLDITTGNPTLVGNIPLRGILPYIRAYGHHFIMCTTLYPSFPSGETSANITAVHTETLKTLSTFEIPFSVERSVAKMFVHHDNLMVICCEMYGEVWDWKKQIHLYTLPSFVSTYFINDVEPVKKNDHCTLMHMRKTLNVDTVRLEIYNFW